MTSPWLVIISRKTCTFPQFATCFINFVIFPSQFLQSFNFICYQLIFPTALWSDSSFYISACWICICFLNIEWRKQTRISCSFSIARLRSHIAYTWCKYVLISITTATWVVRLQIVSCWPHCWRCDASRMLMFIFFKQIRTEVLSSWLI